MDKKRLKEVKARAKDLFFVLRSNEELDVAERFFAECESRGLRVLERLKQDNDRLQKLLEITRGLNQEKDLKALLSAIIDSGIDLTGAERGFLLVQAPGELERFEVARNFDREDITNPEVKVSHTIANEVFQTGRALLCSNAQDDPRFQAVPSVKSLSLRAILCAPFRARDRVLGVVYLDNRFAEGVFREEDLALLEAFAAQAAVAIEGARLLEENRQKAAQVELLNRELEARVETQSIKIHRIQQLLTQKQSALAERSQYGDIVGASARMQEIFSLLDRIVETDLPVLVTGESGTGKEMIARVLHYEGPRSEKEFVSENCAAIAPSLLESELFGHVKGAFTGASRDKEGLFELASGGTLFLDEIGDMPLEMQTKLLRVLQEKSIRRVGGDKRIDVDVRVITATNRDLRRLVEEGAFREDLYFRLNVLSIDLPPLRERPGDVRLLVDHFLALLARERATELRVLEPEALRYLEAYPWPGNIRELANEIRRLDALADGTIRASHLSRRILKALAGGGRLEPVSPEDILPLDIRLSEVEKEEIARALAACHQNKTKTAEVLGISRYTLNRKLERLGISPE
ncbi:MAG: sigma-54-dependent Fis family transcriptional regulator [Planctomycetes bacterium]|nr:sigma-54-dependent Fis family transcriptional regulator [Planctomycetota bacterium]